MLWSISPKLTVFLVVIPHSPISMESNNMWTLPLISSTFRLVQLFWGNQVYAFGGSYFTVYMFGRPIVS